MFFAIVPEQSAYIVQRFGKFHKVLQPGLNWLIPLVDRIAYRHVLKQESIDIQQQTVITKDNVTLQMDGMLFLKIEDPEKASYKIENPKMSIKLLALTVMRGKIGNMKLDELFQERDKINVEIHSAVNKASKEWGVNCLRYQILNIDPPEEIRKAMEYEVEAERLKRQEILISEAKKIAKINEEDGLKKSYISKAQGIAEGIEIIANHQKQANTRLNEALNNNTIKNYVLLTKYLEAYGEVLKESKVVVAPRGEGDSSNTLALAMLMMGGVPRGNTQNLEEDFSRKLKEIAPRDADDVFKKSKSDNKEVYADSELMSEEEEYKKEVSEAKPKNQ